MARRKKEMAKIRTKIHVCPECGGKEFITGVAVTQDWKVDEHGNFIEEVTSCNDVLDGPCDENDWQCANCGAIAVVTYEDDGDDGADGPDGSDDIDGASIEDTPEPCEDGDAEAADFIMRACDRIDNAVYDAVCCALRGGNDEVLHAMYELAWHGDVEKIVPDPAIYDAAEEISRCLVVRANEAGLDAGNPEWDMSVIGNAADDIESVLGGIGIRPCHPFWDGDGLPCYDGDRCKWCDHVG